MHLDEVLEADPRRNRIMAAHLPQLIDEYFLRLQAAAQGAYEPSRTTAPPKTSHLPKTVQTALANMRAFSGRIARLRSHR